MIQRFITWLPSPLKWVLMFAGLVFIVLLINVAFDLSTNGFIDARDAHFRMDEHTFPSPDGTKAVRVAIFRDEPLSTSMILDQGRSGCGIFSYPDTGLALAIRWVDDDHVLIIGPDSLRSGLNVVNDTCQSFQKKAYVSYQER
jgi:hypothetical protein